MAKENKSTGKVPNLRFPGFDGEWKEGNLGKLAEISSGGTPSRTTSTFWNGEIPWVTTSLINSNIVSEAEEYITEPGLKGSSAKLFPKNTVLMAMYGQGKTRGKVAILGMEAATNQACAAIIPNPSLISYSFLFQNLSKRYDEIRELSNQGGQQNLSGGIIKGIKILYPSFNEQTKIAELLSKIDSRIDTQNKIIENLKVQMLGLQEKIFRRKIKMTDESKNDFPDWAEKNLGELGETFNGLSGKTKDDFGKGKLYIQYKQIFDSSKIRMTDCGKVEILEGEKQNKVQYGDIFFTTSSETPNEIGMSSVLLDVVNEAYLNSFCFGYRPSSLDVLNPIFASYFFRSTLFRNQITNLAQGSTRYNMSKVELMKLKVLLPSSEEQIVISNVLFAFDKRIEVENNILERYKIQKQYLLQNLFI